MSCSKLSSVHRRGGVADWRVAVRWSSLIALNRPCNDFVPLALLIASLCVPVAAASQESRVLVFSKTAGFRHSSIGAGIAAIRKLGQENGFAVDATEDAGAFTSKNLARYRAVVFLSTTGDVLDAAQQDDFERYIQAGGGYVGIHSATDTEYDWPWYGRLAGAWFTSHPNNPNVRKGTFRVLDKSHVSTQGLPDRVGARGRVLQLQVDRPDIHVLVDIDEKSYEGGTNGDRHPMSWYHDFDGGRAWYTNMGHTEATFSEPLFLRHLLGGLRYAMGTGTLDYSARAARGEPLHESRSRREAERAGGARGAARTSACCSSSATATSSSTRRRPKRVTRIATIPVSTKYADSSQAEDGLLGLAADPSFATNGFVYMYYSPAGPEPKNVLARFTMKGDSLDLASTKVMLEVPVQRDQCCHTGGSIAFDAQGQSLPLHRRQHEPVRHRLRADRRAAGPHRRGTRRNRPANTNDLRGKIIRIHPEPDGTYTIPEGNLFPKGTAKTRPEIYTMGHRNPYRISVDSRTGFLYWGDVGPDANGGLRRRGPRGLRRGRTRRAAPGNFGWPYFVGNNKAYFKTTFRLRDDDGRASSSTPRIR